MIRSLIIVVNLFIVLILQLFNGQPTAEVKSPSTVKAGESFIATVTIAPNGEMGYLRYDLNLPNDWVVEKVETAGAIFQFEKQTAKFSWAQVGDVKELIISFKIFAPSYITGNFSFKNQLTYTADNLPVNIKLAPIAINVTEGIGNNSPLNEMVITDSIRKPNAKVNLTRVVPTELVDKTFIVELILEKGDLNSFGKIEDYLPAGCTAKVIKADGADFKFEKGIVKFSWYVLPIRQSLRVQYSVTVPKNINGAQLISGNFSYIENESGKLLGIAPSTVTMKEQEIIVKNTQLEQPVAAKVEEKQPVVAKAVVKQAEPAKVVVKKEIKKNVDTPTFATRKITDSNVAANRKVVATKKELKAEPSTTTLVGVSYSVQIAAMLRLVSPSYYKKIYGLTGDVKTEQVNGLNKYTNGSFADYNGAHDQRNEIRTNGGTDAFVTAYNNGNRITVQEALMITTQKWIQ